MTRLVDQLASLADRLEPGSRVAGVRRLRGGLDATTHRFDLVAPAGTRRPLVLRRLTGSWFEPGVAEIEAAVLAALDRAGVPAPRPVWHDGAGTQFGVPAIVMTRLAGRANVDPASGQWWFDELARVLAAIHTASGDGVASIDDDAERIPQWLERAAERATTGRTSAVIGELITLAPVMLAAGSPHRLVHRDYHAGNVVFDGRRATGAVDWGSAASGWPARDVGYCRLDLALMAGGDAPDRFLASYERIVGAPVANLAFWDLFGAAFALPDPVKWLPSWLEWGRADLTPALVRRRLSVWIRRCLADLDA